MQRLGMLLSQWNHTMTSISEQMNALLSIKYDWWQNLDAILPGNGSRSEKIADFQRTHGLDATGFLSAQTRIKLVACHPQTLGIRLIGPKICPRLLLDGRQTPQAHFDKIVSWIVGRRGYFSGLEYHPHIFALRGAHWNGHDICQTESAAQFMREPYGMRAHFSSKKHDYADSVFCVIWLEAGEKRAVFFRGVVNPCDIWPHGTAHLCDGQYFYRIGRHRTRQGAHMEAVRKCLDLWPKDWIFDNRPESIQYIALEGTSPIEVVRSHGECLDISDGDLDRAEIEIARQNPAYVDTQQIKINIHTCAFTEASSLGCQNILPQDYAHWMQILTRLSQLQHRVYGFALNIPYLLCDASWID